MLKGVGDGSPQLVPQRGVRLRLDSSDARDAIEVSIEAEHLVDSQALHDGNMICVSERQISLDVQIECPAVTPLAGEVDPRHFEERKERIADCLFGLPVEPLQGEDHLEDHGIAGVDFDLASLDAAEILGSSWRLLRMICQEMPQQDIGVHGCGGHLAVAPGGNLSRDGAFGSLAQFLGRKWGLHSLQDPCCTRHYPRAECEPNLVSLEHERHPISFVDAEAPPDLDGNGDLTLAGYHGGVLFYDFTDECFLSRSPMPRHGLLVQP
jgi:hypothetical protein